MEASAAEFHCSFCGRASGDVRHLIAGRGVFICNQCVADCRTELGSEPPDAPKPAAQPGSAVPETTLVDVPDSGPRRTMIGRAVGGLLAGQGPECQFCGRAKNQVRGMVERPSVRICNECVGLCEHIIAAEEAGET